MAKERAVSAVEEVKDKNELVVRAGAQLPADMMSEMEGMEGAGTSGAADDNVVPFLSLLQDMSPEAKKRDPAYVEGAEPGFLINKATRRLYPITDKCVVIPVAFHRLIVEWVPRDNGGGFVGRHEIRAGEVVEQAMVRLGGKAVPDPKDTTGRKQQWVLPNGNQLIDTRYHYVMVEDQETGTLSPAVVSFSSTGHQSSRAWMTLMRQPLPGKTQPPPSWFRYFDLARTTRRNSQGEWFVVEARELGWVSDASKRAICRAMHESIASGAVRAAAETDAAPSGSTDAGGDLPI